MILSDKLLNSVTPDRFSIFSEMNNLAVALKDFQGKLTVFTTD